jgi:hypothetical protein
MYRLVSRHALTLWQFKRYVIFSGCADLSADTRKAKRGFDLRRIQNSDYSADTRKSILDQEMWPNDLFASRDGACARLARDVFGPSKTPGYAKSLSLAKECAFAKRRMATHRNLIMIWLVAGRPRSNRFCLCRAQSCPLRPSRRAEQSSHEPGHHQQKPDRVSTREDGQIPARPGIHRAARPAQGEFRKAAGDRERDRPGGAGVR